MFQVIADKIENYIEKLLKEKQSIVVAIDGRCAAGKTTLAACLQEKLNCNVIHMDDFFLRPEQRTEKRLDEPGGNVDYERFLEEVLLSLKRGKDFSYRPYDCCSQCLKDPVAVMKHPITIIEGSYSCHPALYKYYDLHIFLDVDEATQKERIITRNGMERSQMFFEKWIPLEERYFEAYRINEKCKLTFNGQEA